MIGLKLYRKDNSLLNPSLKLNRKRRKLNYSQIQNSDLIHNASVDLCRRSENHSEIKLPVINRYVEDAPDLLSSKIHNSFSKREISHNFENLASELYGGITIEEGDKTR